MYCPKCGAELDENATFCGKCGENIKISGAGPQQGTPNQYWSGSTQVQLVPVMQTANWQSPNDGLDYTPITMWGYFGYEILFFIPCVGFIALLILSLGGTKNINVRNFARSYFCLVILMLIIFVIVAVVTGGSIIALFFSYKL